MPEAKILTGVPGLDELLGGGFPQKATVLLEAPPGTGKTSFCRQFAKEGMDKGQRCIYVATSEPVEQIINGLKAVGIEDLSNIYFIDGYSWRISGDVPEPPKNVVRLASLTELNELTRLLKKEISGLETGSRIVLDSLSDMLLYAEPSSVFKFLQLFVGLVKGSNVAAVVVLEEGLHEPRFVATVSYICDGTIYFKLDGNMRSICVKRMLNTLHPLKWVPFTLSQHGVQIKVADFFA
ncbi:RAD55 family ATPase [archaeon]